MRGITFGADPMHVNVITYKPQLHVELLYQALEKQGKEK